MKRFLFIACCLCALLPILRLDAALPVASEDINLSITPSTPGPHQNAHASLDSSVTDLSLATISWKVNGVSAGSGKGLTSIDFTTGNLGTRTTVTALITSPDGSFTKEETVASNSVDLLWQGNGYTPPFYEGRRLWGHQTTLTIYAVPHIFTTGGAPIGSSNLTFRWSKDGDVLEQSSGVGKDSISVFDTLLGLPANVSVDILTDRNTVAATASLSLSSTDQALRVYEDNPLLGYLFNREVGDTYALKDKEITFAAFPFYFSTTKRTNANISYTWNANNTDSQTGSEVTYRAPDTSGSSAITLSVRNAAQVLQSLDKDFLVQFNQ